MWTDIFIRCAFVLAAIGISYLIGYCLMALCNWLADAIKELYRDY